MCIRDSTSANRPSRFTEEIPAHLLERTGRSAPTRTAFEWDDDFDQSEPRPSTWRSPYSRGESSGYSAPSYAGRSGTSGGYSRDSSPWNTPARSQRPISSRPAAGYTPPAKPSATPLPAYQKGDSVEHKAFGRGMILSMQKMGGDALVEIAFDNVGTKRLMLKSAAQHMKKV